MTPEQLSVYDNYPTWFKYLTDLCTAAQALPLEHMLAANTRMALTGGMIGPDKTEPATPEALGRQRELIEKVIVFRDSVSATR